MLRQVLLVRLTRVGRGGHLPVARVLQQGNPCLRIGHVLALRMLADELLVGIGGVGRGGLLPVRLLVATARQQRERAGEHRYTDRCRFHGPDCNSRGR
jgi:hypothetical protein